MPVVLGLRLGLIGARLICIVKDAKFMFIDPSASFTKKVCSYDYSRTA